MGRGPADAVQFVLRGVAASLGLFGLLRLNWTAVHVVLPLTRLQAGLAVGVFGTPLLPIEATLACSGTDALALCLGAMLAYPVQWRRRLAGAAGGAALILGLNILRIGALGRAASSAAWFNALHLYVWPAVLTLAIAGYVLAWMRFADRRQTLTEPAVAAGPSTGLGAGSSSVVRPPPPLATARQAPQPTRRFVAFTAGFVLLFSAASPLYLESRGIFALAGFIARAAAATLGIAGVTAHAAGNILWTSRGGFLVTQECISTPLVPIYLAAVCAYSTTWRRLTLGILATVPLFTALGIARLLVVALPGAVMDSPLFLVHAFYQLILGAVVVFLAALWRHGSRTALRHALLGGVVGVLFVLLLAPLVMRAVAYTGGLRVSDPQGAIAFLPAFQVGLYLALWVATSVVVGWRPFLAGLAVLGLTQTAGLLALYVLASHVSLTAHVRDVRGWAVAGPVLIFAAVVKLVRPSR